jgi:hypothetical protein
MLPDEALVMKIGAYVAHTKAAVIKRVGASSMTPADDIDIGLVIDVANDLQNCFDFRLADIGYMSRRGSRSQRQLSAPRSVSWDEFSRSFVSESDDFTDSSDEGEDSYDGGMKDLKSDLVAMWSHSSIPAALVSIVGDLRVARRWPMGRAIAALRSRRWCCKLRPDDIYLQKALFFLSHFTGNRFLTTVASWL